MLYLTKNSEVGFRENGGRGRNHRQTEVTLFSLNLHSFGEDKTKGKDWARNVVLKP